MSYFDVTDLTAEVCLEASLLFSGKGTELFMAFDFLFNSLILFFNDVNVAVEVVNVVDQRVVLLFGFAESRYDLIVGADASPLLNLFKSILNNFDVSNIHVHEFFLFLVVG
jgi:DeoR/GlpR family transcriptional regulator of sugar metabolism